VSWGKREEEEEEEEGFGLGLGVRTKIVKSFIAKRARESA
jgi:hypothetical protein